jgi:Bacterial regulatory helix-turn-helix protein, lysR family
MSPKNAAPPPVRRTLPRENILNTVDLNLLPVFDVLMKERSVTRAAERPGRTQPAVSHSLSRLRHLSRTS